jgi:agmatine/peptidylarginine deiminase
MADFRFGYIPYPLWRRRWPLPGLGALVRLGCRWFYPVAADTHPPATPRQMARFMARWGLLTDLDERAAHQYLSDYPPEVTLTRADAEPPPAPPQRLRLPAQWEPIAAVLLTWPVLYPPLWAFYAQLAAAIAPAAPLIILVPRPTWASGVQLYLDRHKPIDRQRVQFLSLPTHDIWVRDYGPCVGVLPDGAPVVTYAHFAPLPHYPQTLDEAMPRRWAAHLGLPGRQVPLQTEGGNLWSDGVGTFIMSDIFTQFTPLADFERILHEVFDFQKLIVTPHLAEEETGHVDLLVKLADAQTVLISAPGDSLNSERLAAAGRLFRQQTNAQGQPYTVFELPSLPPYYNWGLYPIWRSYTNALTVNGRVLVPIYGEKADDAALAVYQQAMPGYTIIPIDCRVVINGGGAVHCLTRDIPRTPVNS